MKIYAHVIIAITLVYFLAQVSWCEDLRTSEFLLPGNLIPTHYDITLEILDNCSDTAPEFQFDRTFVGRARILLTAIEPNVTAIELNCLNLIISRAVIFSEGGSEYVELGLSECDSVTRKVTLYSPVGLPMSETLVLCITFVGNIGTFYDKGIFLTSDIVNSARKPGDFQQIYSIGTLFQPAAARQAFPCFDEPKYKATFQLTLNVSTCILKKGYSVLSNTPSSSLEKWDDRSIVYFESTDFLMPTYLFSFVITPYISTPVKFFNSSFPNVHGTEWKELKTWGPQNIVQSWIGYVAEEVGSLFLELFSRHLNIGYPLKKMDQVFILDNYNIYGMENWGVIAYSSSMRRNYTLVQLLGHEIAHQWFGNLVTCRWWSELWLNEGFATYFSYYGMDKLCAENLMSCLWNPKLLIIVEALLPALDSDANNFSHALTTPVESPSDYDKMFSKLTYAKGGSVIRMWSHVLGEKVFIKGIQKYLQKNQFGTSTPELLLEAFDGVTKDSASDFGNGLPSKYFKNWHMESGFPVVEVKKCPTNSSVYILTQRVFGKRDSPKVKWTIPISYTTNINKDFDKTHAMLWFKEEDSEARIVLPSPVNWIIVNNQFTGFYRVKYDRENYENLAQQLISVENYRDIHEANRIQIMSDLFAFVKRNDSKDVDFRFFMDLSLYLKHETSYLPWKSTLDTAIDYLNTMLGKNYAVYRFFKCRYSQRHKVSLFFFRVFTKHLRESKLKWFPEVPPTLNIWYIRVAERIFEMYVNDLLQDNYSKLSFCLKSSDSYNDKQLREELVKWACKMDHSDCVSQSYYFVNTFSLRSQIHNKVYDTALCTNIRRNMKNGWDVLWETYQSTPNFEERNVILHGISCSTDVDVLSRLLMKSIDKTLTISKDERKSFFVAVLNGDPRNVDIALNFFSDNYLSIKEMYGGLSPVSDLLLLLSKKIGTDDEIIKMKGIMEVLARDERVNLRENEISEAMEICKSNNNWIKTKSQDVNVWLLSHYG